MAEKFLQLKTNSWWKFSAILRLLQTQDILSDAKMGLAKWPSGQLVS